MSRCAPAKVRNLVDAAKLLFVLALLFAFAMRRGFAEVKDRVPWVGALLFGFIAITGLFLLITALIYRKPAEEGAGAAEMENPPPGPDPEP
jgi:hypothetical protein